MSPAEWVQRSEGSPPPAQTTRGIVIAIDGPAASGKSSTAHWVAEELRYVHVDSGALYRAATAARLRAGGIVDTWTPEAVLDAVRRISLDVGAAGLVLLIDGGEADSELRGQETTRHVSRVAQMPEVRAWVNEQVRAAASGRSIVVDGRDMGTVVFPDAALKIYLVADPWERARRRLVQRLARHPTHEETAEETDRLVHRDARDATQSTPARDAILIDTTYLTQPEQVERIIALARAVTLRPDDTSAIDGE
ncbi:MAG: (d)CMP kinase [Gemmatimonadaceae bacterium]